MIAEIFIAVLWGAFITSILFIFFDNSQTEGRKYWEGYHDGYEDSEAGYNNKYYDKK